jgi:hypothetical protein
MIVVNDSGGADGGAAVDLDSDRNQLWRRCETGSNIAEQ